MQTSNNDLVGLVVGDLDYCGDQDYPSTANNCASKGHTLNSAEWSGAALLEAMAHWYSLATWHDIDLSNEGGGIQETNYTRASSAMSASPWPVPRTGGPLCMSPDPMFALNCPTGTSNEWDWLSFIQVLRLDTGASMKTLLEIVIAYYPTGWVAASPDDSFFTGLDLAMQSHFSNPEYQAWESLAPTWNVDQ